MQYKSTISNLTGATNLVLHDVLSEGLDDPYVSGVSVVTTDAEGNETETWLTSGYTVIYYTGNYKTSDATTEDRCSFEVRFDNSVIEDLTAADVIVVYYRATVTADAVIGGEGNPNETYVSYGTDSYSEHDTTVTYVYEVNVYKYYSDESLIGAKFILYYTTTVDLGEADGTENLIYYAVVVDNTLTGWTSEREEATTLTTDKNGMIYIEGLGPGTYYLEETEAPNGYALLDKAIVITLTEEGTVTYQAEGAAEATEGSTKEVEGNTISNVVEVENIPGYELPAAGGKGTWLYTMMGLLICGGTALVLYRRIKVTY